MICQIVDCLSFFVQDANRLIKQSDKYSQFGEIIVPLFRSLQNYRLGNLVDAYNAYEKAAKCEFLFRRFPASI